jgi:hypothetical protein
MIELSLEMERSISTLLIRSLRDVFGENDLARRRVAETRSIASQARSGPLTLTFNISPLPRPRSWAIADGLKPNDAD